MVQKHASAVDVTIIKRNVVRYKQTRGGDHTIQYNNRKIKAFIKGNDKQKLNIR